MLSPAALCAESSKQAELLTSAALKVGFSGGLVVDFPNSARAKKYFLVLMVGQAEAVPHPARGRPARRSAGLLRGLLAWAPSCETL